MALPDGGYALSGLQISHKPVGLISEAPSGIVQAALPDGGYASSDLQISHKPVGLISEAPSGVVQAALPDGGYALCGLQISHKPVGLISEAHQALCRRHCRMAATPYPAYRFHINRYCAGGIAYADSA
ncbi:hypothetical protein [Pseudocitrobacter corydidari]